MLAAAMAVGCGSSPLSASDLRQQASAICSRADRQITRIPTPGSEGAGNSFLKQGIAALDPELNDLKTLKPPADEAEVYQSGIKALGAELDAVKSATAKLDQGADPVRTFRQLQDTLAPGDGCRQRLAGAQHHGLREPELVLRPAPVQQGHHPTQNAGTPLLVREHMQVPLRGELGDQQ